MQWGVLVRISDDRAGEGLGVARQEADCRELVDRLGGDVAQVYPENDTSAFRRRTLTLADGRREQRVYRPELRRALADLQSGRIEGLVVYDIDRLARDPRDLEDLIDVAGRNRRRVESVTGNINLATSDGIFMARMLVSVAAKASEDTSRRVTRKHQELAEAGRVSSGGNRPYGYTADRMQIVPAEAAIIRELAARRLAGEGWQTLARDLNRRGVPCVTAPQWGIASVRRVLLKPHVAGIRVYRGAETPGVWPPILDRHTWEALRGMTGKYSPPPVRRYLLSGIARCAKCGHGLGASKDRGRLIYRCKWISCGTVSRDMTDLDAYVTAVVLALIADIDLTPPQPPADLKIRDKIAALQGRRAAVIAAFADITGDDPVELRRTLSRLDSEIGQLERRAGDGSRGQLLDTVRGISAADWQAKPLDTRRTVIATLVTVTVGRSARGHGPLDTASVELSLRW